MGSEAKGKRIDAGVGGLVWVRRRNGSWWPGRIMGLNELSESCLVSPRSGTPVKLLGREDASVDWYNLEKSKRVKAFRCGEYDECIEKAKAAAANSNRKTVKYARRDDAILHALELENSLESSDLHDSHPRTESADSLKQNTLARQPQNTFVSNEEHMLPNGKDCMFEANPIMELSQSGISFEDPNHNNSSKVHSLQKNRRKTPNDSEDDGEGTKRMRDLDELGKGVASERNAHSEGSHEFVQLDSTSLSEPNCNSLASGSGINSRRNSCSFLKRKRSQVVNIHDNLKRKNRRRPLTKVLESTAMVSVPVFCDGGPSPGISSLHGVTESKVSALESTESKLTKSSAVMNSNSDSSGASYEKETSLDASEHTCDPDIDAAHVHSESKDNEFSTQIPENDFSDGLFDVPFVVEEKQSEGFPPILTSCTSKMLQSGAMGKRSGHLSQVGSISLSSEGLDESGSASIAVDVINVSQRNEKGTSKWQSKRKRNSRNLNKKARKCKSIDLKRRSIDRDAELEAFLAGWTQKVEINTRDDDLHSLNDSSNWSKQLSESNYSINYGRKSVRNEEAVTPSRRKALMVKSATQFRKEFYLMEGAPIASRRPLPYRKSRFTSHSRYHDTDVYRENYLGVSSLFDVNLEVRATYRGQHVPLVSLMSKLNGKAIVGHPVTVEVWDDGYCDLLTSTISCYPTSNNGELYEVTTENISDHSIDDTVPVGGHVKAVGTLKDGACFLVKSRMEAPPRNPFNKSLKNKKYGLLSRRTRKLSSFNSRMEDKKPVVEKLEGPVIACVPLKVVFTRINEGVNHATRMANRNLTRNE